MSDKKQLEYLLMESVGMGRTEAAYTADHLLANGVEIKKCGWWELHNDGSGTCSECHFTQKCVWDYDNHQEYCGVCGAKMDLED